MKPRILFVQEGPCIRNWKMGVALRKLGYFVGCGYVANTIKDVYDLDASEAYDMTHLLTNPNDVWRLGEWYDLVHCHNEKDTFSTAAAACYVPVVHDCHDLMSARGLPWNPVEEAIANRAADGLCYVSNYQYAVAKSMYEMDQPHCIFHNYVLEDHVPRDDQLLPKVSGGGADIHLVYAGGIGMGDGHRNLVEQFKELVEAGFWVHVYPVATNDTLVHYMKEIDNPRFLLHPKMRLDEMIVEISKYDVGLMPFRKVDSNAKHLDGVMANKVFEYFAAGLPVATEEIAELTAFLTKEKMGITYYRPEHIREHIAALRSIKVDRHAWTVEGNIHKVTELYDELLEAVEYEQRPDLADYRGVAPIKMDLHPTRNNTLLWKAPKDSDSPVKRRYLVGRSASPETILLETLVANTMLEDL